MNLETFWFVGSPQRSIPRTISTQKPEKLKGQEVVSEAQNCSPQRTISRTARTQEPGPAKVQEGTPEIPAEHRIKRDVSREENTRVADHIPRCVYQKQAQGNTRPESMKRLAREIYSIFRNEVLGKTNRNSTRLHSILKRNAPSLVFWFPIVSDTLLQGEGGLSPEISSANH